MIRAACDVGRCESVTGWPSGWQLVALLVIFAGACYAYRAGRD